MTEELKKDALVIYKPNTLFPHWDEKLASMHEHIEFLNNATDKDFKECPIDEETIVMAVVTDLIDTRQSGVHGKIEADAGYIFDSMFDYFTGQYPTPDTTDSTRAELITSHLTAMTKYYTEMYTLLIERLSRTPFMLGEHLCPDDWALEIREDGACYVLTVGGSKTIDVVVGVS